MPQQVSVDGGTTLHSADSLDETALENNWQALNDAMNPDVRLTVGGIVLDDYPNDKRMFLREYLDRAASNLVVG